MIALTGAALWAGPTRSFASGAVTRTIEGRAFASHWRITAPTGVDMEQHRDGLEALLARVDQQMSPWRTDSEITRFNISQHESPLSPEVAIVADAALGIARESGGWFDPTVGPLVAQWGFGPISGTNIGQLQGLYVSGDSLHKYYPGLTMDLCGIAKGRALDLMAAHLLDAGKTDFLIDLGGELKSAGRHPTGRSWQVVVEDPRPSRTGPAVGLFLPSGTAVATSGARAQSYALGDQNYSHIIDPRQASPVASTTASVTVIDDSAMKADGWATALAAAGTDGPDVAGVHNISALFLLTVDGMLHHQTTGGFDRHMA
jgi:thiamine biosynthesis lipoprotein